jgi:serine phosphatase RsbU (regulator of sigma subunit)
MRKVIFILFTLALFNGNAQNRKKLDSLLHVKLGTAEDTIHISYYRDLAYAYRKNNFDSAMYWINKAIALSKKIKSDRHFISSYYTKGQLYKMSGEPKIAVDTLSYVISLSKATEKRYNYSGLNQDLGVTYRILGNFDKSIMCLLESIKEADAKNDKKGQYNACNSLANTYSQLGMTKKSVTDLERALTYYDKALTFADTSNKAILGMVMGNQGVTYFNLGEVRKDSLSLLKARDLYQKALTLKIPLNDFFGISQTYANIASVYHELCNIKPNNTYLEIGKSYYEKALKVDKDAALEGAYSNEANYGTHLALMGKHQNNKTLCSQAIVHLLTALPAAEKYQDISTKMQIQDVLAMCYHELGQNDKAYEHLFKYRVLKDSVLREENKQIAEDLATKYESDLKDAENNSLKNEAQLREEVISKKSTTINVMIIGSVLLLGLIILVLISRQKITRAKQLTEQQKLIIEEKNKEITDSINYAKRLQNTMLPGETSLGSMFAESFILYQPKDIVSGDFYWYSQSGKNRVVAAVDCTGHGVPGAFMSMLGITFLNEIVGQKNIGTPNLILGELRDRVKSTLKQKGLEGEARDGMDIAVINVDLDKNILEYSGANNPIWLCRDDKVIEVNADKRPIGYFKGQGLPFTNHSIELKKGDCVYLFTDGYADQFGGPKGKKFKYKTLSDLLLSIHQKTCADQKQILERTFADWRGDLDQVDDVLLIGIKI